MEVAPTVAEAAGVRFGVVVTEPAYSMERRYQILVPLLDGDEFLAEPGEPVVEEAHWSGDVPGFRTVLLAIRSIQTCFHPRDIARVLGTAVDAATMADLDAALSALFRLE